MVSADLRAAIASPGIRCLMSVDPFAGKLEGDYHRWNVGAEDSTCRGLIIRLIIQTVRRDPSGSVWIDEAPNVSSPDPSGADQIDAEHQATDLAGGGSLCRAADGGRILDERGRPVLDRADTIALGSMRAGEARPASWIDTSAWERSESGRRRVPRRIVREGGGGGGSSVLILGLLLLLLGYLTEVGILQTLGIILLVVGAVLWILGAMRRPVGGRRHYW